MKLQPFNEEVDEYLLKQFAHLQDTGVVRTRDIGVVIQPLFMLKKDFYWNISRNDKEATHWIWHDYERNYIQCNAIYDIDPDTANNYWGSYSHPDERPL